MTALWATLLSTLFGGIVGWLAHIEWLKRHPTTDAPALQSAAERFRTRKAELRGALKPRGAP